MLIRRFSRKVTVLLFATLVITLATYAHTLAQSDIEPIQIENHTHFGGSLRDFAVHDDMIALINGLEIRLMDITERDNLVLLGTITTTSPMNIIYIDDKMLITQLDDRTPRNGFSEQDISIWNITDPTNIVFVETIELEHETSSTQLNAFGIQDELIFLLYGEGLHSYQLQGEELEHLSTYSYMLSQYGRYDIEVDSAEPTMLRIKESDVWVVLDVSDPTTPTFVRAEEPPSDSEIETSICHPETNVCAEAERSRFSIIEANGWTRLSIDATYAQLEDIVYDDEWLIYANSYYLGGISGIQLIAVHGGDESIEEINMELNFKQQWYDNVTASYVGDGWFYYRINDMLYGANIDQRTPDNPQVLESIELYRSPIGTPSNMLFDGTVAYTVGRNYQLSILDLSTPTEPQLMAAIPFDEDVHGVALYEDYAYMTVGTAVHRYDISDPSQPVFVDTPLQFDSEVSGIAIVGEYLYLTKLGVGFYVYGLENLAQPTPLGFVSTTGYTPPWFDELHYVERLNLLHVKLYAYDNHHYTYLYDLSDPTNPIETDYFDQEDAMIPEIGLIPDPDSGWTFSYTNFETRRGVGNEHATMFTFHANVLDQNRLVTTNDNYWSNADEIAVMDSRNPIYSRRIADFIINDHVSLGNMWIHNDTIYLSTDRNGLYVTPVSSLDIPDPLPHTVYLPMVVR